VQQTGKNHLFRQPGIDRMPRALQDMRRRAKAVFEEVDQGRLLRHRRQPGIVAHQYPRLRVLRHQRAGIGRRVHIAFRQAVEPRLDDDVVELIAHLLFERIGPLAQRHRVVHRGSSRDKAVPPRM
jgi:hypothetical protein